MPLCQYYKDEVMMLAEENERGEDILMRTGHISDAGAYVASAMRRIMKAQTDEEKAYAIKDLLTQVTNLE